VLDFDGAGKFQGKQTSLRHAIAQRAAHMRTARARPSKVNWAAPRTGTSL
jgi:hypothetical protein